MSKSPDRDLAPLEWRRLDDRLARLLDTPLLARVVPHLPPEALHQLVRHRGLEASAELVAAATPAQLASLLDIDLWRQQPGRDERFDVDRFGEWIDVLVGAGDAVAARTVAGLDGDLVVAGLTRHVRVFDPGVFEPTAQSDDEAIDRHEAMREGDSIHDATVPGDGLECEVGGYLVRARRADAWDAIVSLLTALEVEHGRCFHAVMQGCRRLSNSRPEADGLDDLLPAPDQHLHDVAIERDCRRARQGYVPAADARAFLQMARQPKDASPGASAAAGPVTANPIVTAYFLAADEASPSSSGKTGAPERTLTSPRERAVRAGEPDVPESLDAVLDLLIEAGMLQDRTRTLPAAPDDPRAARLTCLRRLMAHLREADGAAYVRRSRELAFLANVLLAGCSVQSRPFTPREASDAAAATCSLGLEHWPARWPGAVSTDTSPPDSFLIGHDLVTAFDVGWSVLHRDVGLFVVQQLIAMLDERQAADGAIRRGLAGLRRALAVARDAGTPWRAREAAEVLAELDITAWTSVVGLLGECPVLPAALTAIVNARTTRVSQTDFAFISSAAEICDVRAFMRRLPDLLSP
jgi:hypothetical protein